MPPGRPLAEKFCTQSEYFTISNCVFNFNIRALVVFEILGGSQNYIRRSCAPWTPTSGNNFVPKASNLLYVMAFLISTFYSFSKFRDFRGSQIYIKGPCAPWTPPSGKNFIPKASTLSYQIAFLISTFKLDGVKAHLFQDTRQGVHSLCSVNYAPWQ